MQIQLDMTIVKQAHARARVALEAKNGAALRAISNHAGNYSENLNLLNEAARVSVTSKEVVLSSCAAFGSVNEKTEFTYPENPFSNDVIRDGSYLTWDPLKEFKRSQSSVFTLVTAHNFEELSRYHKAAQLFDFDYWLKVNRKHTAGFESAQLFGEVTSSKTVMTSVHSLWKRYEAMNGGKSAQEFVPKNGLRIPTSLQEKLFVERLHCLYFWMWYTVLALQVERINEFNHFTELMETACCPVQLENVSICVKLFAGHQAEDRDAYLARLRPHFQNHLARVKNKVITCDCGRGIS